MKQRERGIVREQSGMKDNSSPDQTGAEGKTRNTQMLEDVEEPMPTERYQANAGISNLAAGRDGHFVTVSR